MRPLLLALLLGLVACAPNPPEEGRWVEVTVEPAVEPAAAESPTPKPIVRSEYVGRAEVRGYWRDRLVIRLDGEDHYLRATRQKGMDWIVKPERVTR